MSRSNFSTSLLSILLILLAITVFVQVFASGPPERSLTGLTQSAVLSEMGEPDKVLAGHYGNPDVKFTAPFSGEIKTLVFSLRGGEMYVSFEKRGDTWIAICEDWLPSGGVF